MHLQSEIEVAAPRHMPRRRPIDLVHLARQTLGDWDLEREILRGFDASVATCFRRIEQCADRHDLLIHLRAIRGAAAGIGAFGIVAHAEGAERALRTGTDVDMERIEDLGFAIAEASIFIADLLGDRRD